MTAEFLSIIGFYYGFSSIIFAYVLIVLQLWMSGVSSAEQALRDVVENTQEGDIKRDRKLRRLNGVAREYPTLQIALSTGLLVFVCALCLMLSTKITGISIWFTAAPLFAVTTLMVLISVICFLQGNRRSAEANELVRPH